MSHNPLKDATRRLFVSCMFLSIVFGSFAANASNGDPAPGEIFVTLAYVCGTLSAIVYKMAVGSTKHLVGKTFRWRVLIWPIVLSAVISFPLVFVIMPKFGRPTGHFGADMIYAFLTTYVTIDMTADFYIISALIEKKFEQAADKDGRESGPPSS